MRVLRRKELRAKVGLHPATIGRMEAKGQFPKRVRLGPNSIGWLENEVDDFLKKLAAQRNQFTV